MNSRNPVHPSSPAQARIDTALVEIVGERYVSRERGDLAALGVSAEAAPAWLLKPGSAAEIAELIALAHRYEIAVVPIGNQARSPRTAAHSALPSERLRLFIDTRRMDHVLHLDETSLLVHVQAGMTALGLEKILAPRELTLGDYPPAVLSSTIGGLLSVRTPGKSSARHGFIEDAVVGISAVLADGRSVHTRVAPRRSTGPDLARALCGSEGTLGFITSAILRIHRAPPARFLAAYALPDFDAALAAVHLALREEAAPAGLRAYDFAEARALLGTGVGTGVGTGAGELVGGADGGEAILAAATAGPTDLAACDRDLIASAASAMGGRPLGKQVAELWWRQRMGRDMPASLPSPALQVTASPGKQRAVYHAVRAAATDAGVRVRAHASRFDHDGAVLFFTFLSAVPGDETALAGDALSRVRRAAENAAQGAGAVLLGSIHPSVQPYITELRRQLDPKGIMNPGALLAGPSPVL